MSAPFRRPPICTLMPFAATAFEPRRGLMALRMAIFVARRNAMRRSSWDAMSSATSWALVDMFGTSTMFTSTSFLTILESCACSFSFSAPWRPITMPGFAQ